MTLLDRFRGRYPFTFDDFQLEAIQAIEAGQSVIVSAPTGAGKTLVAEFAIHAALEAGRRIAYTTPLKALSNQKFADFTRAFGEDRVGILTGDVKVNPHAPVLVMTTEILRNALYGSGLDDLRTIVLDAGRELDPRPLLWRLRAVDPDCFTFGVPTAHGVLVGASPELLVSRSGPEVRANPLAGSAPRFGDVAEDRASAEGLLASAKDREEHAVVVDAVADTLGPFCEQLTFPSEPTVLGTANVWHLSTPFHGRLRPPAPSAFDLVAALHPTPAVCGTPREAARATIAELESFARGCYAGPVGWVDANGDGEWAIALRCAEIAGTTARLFAGAGIVADSVPEQELDETERKFRALLDSLRWG